MPRRVLSIGRPVGQPAHEESRGRRGPEQEARRHSPFRSRARRLPPTAYYDFSSRSATKVRASLSPRGFRHFTSQFGAAAMPILADAGASDAAAKLAFLPIAAW